MKDPFVLEFLHIDERPRWRERDLEQSIIDRLEAFLLELGKGFCFVARQKRVTLDGDHFYVDLVLTTVCSGASCSSTSSSESSRTRTSGRCRCTSVKTAAFANAARWAARYSNARLRRTMPALSVPANATHARYGAINAAARRSSFAATLM